jgi:hypothetical protein
MKNSETPGIPVEPVEEYAGQISKVLHTQRVRLVYREGENGYEKNYGPVGG